MSWSEAVDESADARQHWRLMAGEGRVVGAVELDEFRMCDMTGEMPAGADANGTIAAAMEHQGRRGNLPEKRPHIRIAQGLEHALDRSRARRRAQQACP